MAENDAPAHGKRAAYAKIDTTPGRPMSLILSGKDGGSIAHVELTEYLAHALAADLLSCTLIPRGYTMPRVVRADGRAIPPTIMPARLHGPSRRKH
jgi:hypothetical protein